MLIKSDSTISLRVGDPIQSLKILRSHEVMKDVSMRHSIDIIQKYLDDIVNDVNPDFYSAKEGKDKNKIVESFRDIFT